MTLPGDGEICGVDETLARGITSMHLHNGEITEKLFSGKEVSVNLLSKLSLADSVAHFKRDLPRPEQNLIYWGHALLNVGNLLASAAEYKIQNKAFDGKIGVVYRPTPSNSGHAQIEPKISTGFARKLTNEVKGRKDIFPDDPGAVWT